MLLRVDISETGEVTDVNVAKSSGFTLLDDAAKKSVRRWRFKPSTVDGKAVIGTVMVSVEFKLK